MGQEVIELKMSWVGMAGIIKVGLLNGNEKGKAIAAEALLDMAKAADQAVELQEKVNALEAQIAAK